VKLPPPDKKAAAGLTGT